jgi:glycerol uptake facilitator-like aquaporin
MMIDTIFYSRLFTLMAGWKEATFNTADYFFWIPWLVPHIGGVVGGILYTVMVEGHHPDNVD